MWYTTSDVNLCDYTYLIHCGENDVYITENKRDKIRHNNMTSLN